MRQTGRTTRIVDFVVQQLLETGQCICTDHTAFEVNGVTQKHFQFLIDSVALRIRLMLAKYEDYNLRAEFDRTERGGIPCIWFQLIRESKESSRSAKRKLNLIREILD